MTAQAYDGAALLVAHRREREARNERNRLIQRAVLDFVASADGVVTETSVCDHISTSEGVGRQAVQIAIARLVRQNLVSSPNIGLYLKVGEDRETTVH